MRTESTHLPMTIKLFALLTGAPLSLYGLALMASDVAHDVTEFSRSHVLTAGPHFGLALGPIFVLVGLSFLWPLRPFHVE